MTQLFLNLAIFWLIPGINTRKYDIGYPIRHYRHLQNIFFSFYLLDIQKQLVNIYVFLQKLHTEA